MIPNVELRKDSHQKSNKIKIKFQINSKNNAKTHCGQKLELNYKLVAEIDRIYSL